MSNPSLPESAEALISRLRSEKEQDSLLYRDFSRRFTEAGELAIRACLEAGLAGNVTCSIASKRILSLLSHENS